MSNVVTLKGTATVRKSWAANGDKQAMLYGSVKADGKDIDITAYGAAAEAFGNADGLTVVATGKVAYQKPKDWKQGDKVRWPMCVVIEEVKEQAPRGAAQEDDVGF